MNLAIGILIAVGVGITAGYYLPVAIIPIDTISTWALAAVLFGVGIDMGMNRSVWKQLRRLGFGVILVPFAIAIASLCATALCGKMIGLNLKEGLAIGAGFGWYSLSAGIISNLYDPVLGGLALLTNVFREVLGIISVPIIAKYLGYLPTVAPGGATSMDSSLPIISKVTEGKATPIAFISGAVLSALVPILVPLILSL